MSLSVIAGLQLFGCYISVKAEDGKPSRRHLERTQQLTYYGVKGLVYDPQPTKNLSTAGNGIRCEKGRAQSILARQ